jgi:pimeloyl-ACP methyl ester carboxylesterase
MIVMGVPQRGAMLLLLLSLLLGMNSRAFRYAGRQRYTSRSCLHRIAAMEDETQVSVVDSSVLQALPDDTVPDDEVVDMPEIMLQSIEVEVHPRAVGMKEAVARSLETASVPNHAGFSEHVDSLREGLELSFWQEDVCGTGKPPCVYFPGLDGTGNFSADALSNLRKDYDLWRVCYEPEDQISFLELASRSIKFLETFDEAPVVIGESFGGLLASYLAVRLQRKLSKLVLVNPASAYDQTMWPILGPLVASSGPAYPIVGLTTLLATCMQPAQLLSLSQPIISAAQQGRMPTKEINDIMETSLPLLDKIQPSVLSWRLKEWLAVGAYVMKEQYGKITTPTVVLAGVNDRMLPSKREAKRLQKVMRRTTVEVIEFTDSSHAFLYGSVDLAEVIAGSTTFAHSSDALDLPATK